MFGNGRFKQGNQEYLAFGAQPGMLSRAVISTHRTWGTLSLETLTLRLDVGAWASGSAQGRPPPPMCLVFLCRKESVEVARAQSDASRCHAEPGEAALHVRVFFCFCFCFAEHGEVPGPAGTVLQWHSVSILCKQALRGQTVLKEPAPRHARSHQKGGRARAWWHPHTIWGKQGVSP